jgi:formate hydrogenlyase subunit 3/multisubunit Na+/H+ antiporter MnhD subunit
MQGYEIPNHEGNPLVSCCVCCCACGIIGIAVTYIVWCIVVVSNNGHLQDVDCPHVAQVWWTITIMLIVQATNICVLPCIFGYENWKMQQDPEYAKAMQVAAN